MKKHTIGIIGAGQITTDHIESFLKDGRSQIKWICSRRVENASKKAKLYNIPNYTTDYHNILNDDEVNIVVITTPPHLHVEMAEEAFRAGKNVLLEKPGAIDIDGIERLSQLISTYPDLYIMECSARHSRLTSKFKKIKEIVDSKKIGDIYHIRQIAHAPNTYVEHNSNASWSSNKKNWGGLIYDWCVYDLSFHLGLLNDTPEFSNVMSNLTGIKDNITIRNNSINENHISLLMEYTGNLSFYYERTAGIYPTWINETHLFGSEGIMVFDYQSWGSNRVRIIKKGSSGYIDSEVDINIVSEEEKTDSLQFIEHFLDCLENRSEETLSFENALKHLKIIDMCNIK